MHPSRAREYDQDTEDELRCYLQKEPKIVALTEIGLDQTHKVPLSVQEQAMVRQIQIAIQLKKPICLHIRGACEEAFTAMSRVGILLHGHQELAGQPTVDPLDRLNRAWPYIQ